MNRDELIRTFVLDQIMDDYEELDHITESIAKWSAQCSVVVQRQDVVQALVSLTEHGFAKAYSLGRDIKEIEGVPPPDYIQDPDLYSRCYFLVSDKGREENKRLRSLATWPFDDDGKLKV
jgi:hypothetical protein